MKVTKKSFIHLIIFIFIFISTVSQDNSFILSYTFTVDFPGDPIDNALVKVQHTIDMGTQWQTGIGGRPAFPTSAQVLVDSPTDDSLDGTYTPLNPTQIILFNGREIFDRGGTIGNSESIHIIISGLPDYFFFSEFVGLVPATPAVSSIVTPDDFTPISLTSFQEHHISHDVPPGGSFFGYLLVAQRSWLKKFPTQV